MFYAKDRVLILRNLPRANVPTLRMPFLQPAPIFFGDVLIPKADIWPNMTGSSVLVFSWVLVKSYSAGIKKVEIFNNKKYTFFYSCRSIFARRIWIRCLERHAVSLKVENNDFRSFLFFLKIFFVCEQNLKIISEILRWSHEVREDTKWVPS